ncbi:MAG: PQQ-binding-like beta-propeller repeat protein [Deltaproteobacteria bacterium]|nr:PQQ-binding-like beta-propeller repeat protein [Deltaproteobacteria bacterium]
MTEINQGTAPPAVQSEFRGETRGAESKQPGQGWLVCPKCGYTSRKTIHVCPNCNYFSSSWYAPSPKYSRWPKRIKIASIIIFPIILLLAVLIIRSPYTPNPFNRTLDTAQTGLQNDNPDVWAGYGDGPTHDRYKPSGPMPVGNVKWSIRLGTEATESAPAVSNGILYVGGYFKIHALEAATGKVLWETDTTGPVHSSPAVYSDLMYVGLLDGRLIALHKTTGRQIWEFQTGSFIFSPPVVVDGVLYQGSGDEMFYALDAKTGELFWELPGNGRLYHAPAVTDGVIYLPAQNRSLYSLGAKNGVQRMRFRTYRDLVDSPVVANGLVYYVTRDGPLSTIRHKARDFPGEYALKWMWTQLWLWDVPGIPAPKKQAGAMWSVKPFSSKKGFSASPAVTPDALFVGDLRGKLYARDAHTGNYLWGYRTQTPITTSPLAVGDQVFFGNEQGVLHALDQKNGRLLWKLSLGTEIITGPVYATGLIYVKTADGKLHAVE